MYIKSLAFAFTPPSTGNVTAYRIRVVPAGTIGDRLEETVSNGAFYETLDYVEISVNALTPFEEDGDVKIDDLEALFPDEEGPKDIYITAVNTRAESDPMEMRNVFFGAEAPAAPTNGRLV